MTRKQHRFVLDLGGTNLTVGYSPDRESFEWTRSYRLKDIPSPEDWLETLFSDQPEIQEAKWIFGVPGPCDENEPERTPNLPGGWDFSQIQAILSELEISPCFINDAHLAALGMVRDLNETPDCILGITLGTGIGGGIVRNGRLDRGSTGAAAEVGHIVLQPGGRSCSCGKNGCFETYASARGLERTYHDRTGNSRTAREIAREDSEDAQKALHETGRYLGRGLATATNVLNPDRIILAGGLAGSYEQFREPTREMFRRNVFAESARSTPIERHERNHPALHGGLSLTWS